MKASNKVLLVALILLLTSLTLYDFELKAEYEKGEFKKEFYLYDKLNHKDFDEIEVNAGNLLDLKIVRADKFDIRLRKYYNKPFKISQKKNKLVIDVTDSLNSPWMSGEKAMVIFCPKLTRLTIRGQVMTFRDRNRTITEMIRNNNAFTELIGFTDDSLNLKLGSKCYLSFTGNNVKNLNAIIGDDTGGGAEFTINGSNVIGNASFQIKGKNELRLDNPKIEHLNYTYSKDATITLSGAAHSFLK